MKLNFIYLFLFFGVMFWNCSEYEENFETLKYLELESPIENLSGQQEIIVEAQKRLEKFIKIKQNQFVLEITSGKEVNMSEDLFHYFQNTIAVANEKANEKGYVIEGDRVMRECVSIPRLKSLAENGSKTYVISSGVEYTWYGMRIDISSQDIKGIQLGTTTLGLVLERCKTGTPQVDAVIESAGLITIMSGALASYYDNGNGFSIICPLYVPTYVSSY